MTTDFTPQEPTEGSLVEDTPTLRHRFNEGGPARLHYVTGGTGPAVVLLHGFPYTWEVWKPLLPLLIEAGYTVIVPDLRGLGHSQKTEDGYDKVTVAGDVRRIVQTAGFETIRLVGADLGAMVAYAYASRHPAEVERLVFAESFIPGFGLEERMNPADGGYWHFGFHAQVEVATMLTAGREGPYLLPWYAMMSTRDGAAAAAERRYLPFYRAAGGMRAGFRHYETLIEDGRANRAQFTGKLPMPTLVLGGERGIPHAQTLACVEQVAGSVEHDLVPGAGHTFASDNPAWTAARLVRFFQPNRRRKPTMKVAVLGASGSTGTLVVKKLLERGHAVVALSRSPWQLQPSDPRLSPRHGELTNADFLRGAITGCDAVISCGGQNRASKSLFAKRRFFRTHQSRTDKPPQRLNNRRGARTME